MNSSNPAATILGIDLAWGEKNPDGLAVMDCDPGGARLVGVARSQGDAALMEWIGGHCDDSRPCVAAIDAPIICPNESGSRPVDRLMHVHFHRQHAGCYPANRQLCPRPHRIGELLRERRFDLTADLASARIAFEVYPHPAMVRFCKLDQIVRYKRGPVAQRRIEFARLQRLVVGICERFRVETSAVREVFSAPWSKSAEDQIDAIICTLIGLNHWQSRGIASQVLGDSKTGLLIIPSEG